MQRPRSRRPTAPLVLSTLALVVALGGVAYSAIPDANGVIHGCYEAGRVLTVIDSAASCPAGQTALNWNQQGPQGPQGQQGPQGPPGQPPAYTKAVAKKTVPGGGGFVEVARLDVPAGRYVVIAKALAFASGSKVLGITAGGCQLKVGIAAPNGQLALEQASDFTSANLVTGNGVPVATAQLVALLAHDFGPRGTLTKPGAISLRCAPGVVPSPDVDFRNVRLAAIRVAELPDFLASKALIPKAVKRKVTAVVKRKQ